MQQTIMLKMFTRQDRLLTDQAIEAEIKDGLAIHESVEWPGRWRVTHVKSGLACGDYKSRRIAQQRRKIFAQMEVGGVRFADMEACEALSLMPVLLEQWQALRGISLNADEREYYFKVRDDTADILTCQHAVTR